jgi:Na+/proline symporter
MGTIDFTIVGLYMLAMIIVGMWFQRKASQNIDSYFLGDRQLPWWALGASGMSSNLDISGTMIIVALVYAIGARGFYIEIRGGVTLIMAFLMIFIGKWSRRANVMTLAEWMEFRFGNDREGRLARFITAVTSIIMTVAMITYFAIGGGKFLGSFLGIPDLFGLPSHFWAASILIALATVYTVASGLYGVIWTDVFQGFLIFLAIAYVAVKAFAIDLPEEFFVSMPLKESAGGGFKAYLTSFHDWTSIIPRWHLDIDSASTYSMYNLFGVAVLFYLFKVILEGTGGTGNYMIQRYFAAKDDREAGLLSLFWTFLLSFRWPFIAAMAVWGVSLTGQISDPEMVLPAVVATLPVGIKGFLIAGLMAAAMSTFDSTVNAGAAYWVKDIYLTMINPQANHKQQMKHSYVASLLLVLSGLLLTLFIKNINEIWGWITMSIGAGLLIPQLVRWYWWRLNGYGYAIGMAAGTVSAIIWKIFAPEALPEYYAFMLSSGLSLLGTIIGTYLTKPTDREVLKNFYERTRPFGAWSDVRKEFSKEFINDAKKENARDIFSIFFAVPWQICLFLMWMMLIMKRWDNFIVTLILTVILSVILYFSWFRHLSQKKIKQ